MNDNRERITAEEIKDRDIDSRAELNKFRVAGGSSLFEDFSGEICAHRYRCVSCYGDWDVSECSKCGNQIVEKCSFDEEYD